MVYKCSLLVLPRFRIIALDLVNTEVGADSLITDDNHKLRMSNELNLAKYVFELCHIKSGWQVGELASWRT